MSLRHQQPTTPLLTKTSSILQAFLPSYENTYLSPNGEIIAEGINFCNPKIISEILVNYSHLKQDSYDRFLDDTWYMMQDFDELCGRALSGEPVLERIVELKIDGKQNNEI